MRPTLKDQLAWKWKVDDMTDEELVDFFTLRHDWLGRIDLWVFGNLYLLWCTVHWSWFCIWCGKYHFKITSKPCKYYQPLKSKKEETMVKQYKQQVNSCFGCPNYRVLVDRDTEILWCRVAGQVHSLTPYENKIPDWCPLPEIPAKKEVMCEYMDMP